MHIMQSQVTSSVEQIIVFTTHFLIMSIFFCLAFFVYMYVEAPLTLTCHRVAHRSNHSLRLLVSFTHRTWARGRKLLNILLSYPESWFQNPEFSTRRMCKPASGSTWTSNSVKVWEKLCVWRIYVIFIGSIWCCLSCLLYVCLFYLFLKKACVCL